MLNYEIKLIFQQAKHKELSRKKNQASHQRVHIYYKIIFKKIPKLGHLKIEVET